MNTTSQTNSANTIYKPFTAKADYRGRYESRDSNPRLPRSARTAIQSNCHRSVWARQLQPVSPYRDPNAAKFLTAADWLVTSLERNRAGLWVWNHHFDWEYRTPQSAVVSALAQGQGISLLVRALIETAQQTCSNRRCVHSRRIFSIYDSAFGPFTSSPALS